MTPQGPRGVVVPEILVVDDHALLAESLAAVLRDRGMHAETLLPHSLTALADDLLARPDPPELVMLDLDLGQAGRSLPLVQPLARRGVRVLVVSGSTNDPEVGACLEAGALGFVSKASPFDDLLDAVDVILRGGEVLTEHQRMHYLTSLWEARGEQEELAEPFARLTLRETEVLHSLCEGHSAQEIAAHGYVSLATVRTQVQAILTKLGVGSQLEAVAQAYRSGWHIMHAANKADTAATTEPAAARRS